MCNIWHYVVLTAKTDNRYICQYLPTKINRYVGPRVVSTNKFNFLFSIMFYLTTFSSSGFGGYFFPRLEFLSDRCEN